MNREFEFSRSTVKDDRTAKVSFSSEQPVLRRGDEGGYWEVLSHDPAHVDLSLITDGGAVLYQHDAERQIGVIEQAWLASKRGYAKLRFSQNRFADEIFQDVRDGIQTKVSVGYSTTKLISSVRGEGGFPVNTYAWKPHEISIVAVPADNTVGVGREAESELIVTRSNTVFMNEYSNLLKSIRGEREELPTTADTIRALVGNHTSDAVERHNAHLRQSMGGLPDSGMGMSGCIYLSFEQLRRDLNVNTFSQGGATIGDYRLPPILPLQNLTVAERCGSQIITDFSGSGHLPRFTSTPTAQNLGESDTGADSTPATDLIRIAPHRVSASVIYSRQWDIQSPGATKALASLILRTVAVLVDRVYLFGQGAGNEPLGIFNRDGIGKIDFGGAATWDKVIGFETALTDKNVECNPASTWYVTSPKTKSKWKNIAKGDKMTQAIWESSGGIDYVNGYRALASSQMSGNHQVGFVDFSQTMLCIYGQGIELQYNPYTFDREGKVRITAHIWVDVAAEHNEAIAISDDAGNQ